MKQLWILYDAQCGFCCRCRDWLKAQPQLVPLRFLDKDGPEARERFQGLRGMVGPDELVAVSEDGMYYQSEKAWVVCLWALKHYRTWGKRLAAPMMRPLARRLYGMIAGGRHSLSEAFGLLSDGQLRDVLEAEQPRGCTTASCTESQQI